MIQDLLIPFISILLAEFGDKTQIAIFSMSSKYKKNLQIFLGSLLAFIIIDGLAIYFANEISSVIPIFWIKIISGTLFVIFGIIGFFENDKKNENENKKFKKIRSPFLTSFLIILFAEFGDKSQLASSVFATIYNPLLVFIGILIALILLTIIAIIAGKILIKKFDKELIEKISNSIFLIIGILTIFSVLI